DGCLDQALAQVRKGVDVFHHVRHQYSKVGCTASNTRSVVGRYWGSRGPAGQGTSNPVTLWTGAARPRKQLAVITGATPAPRPAAAAAWAPAAARRPPPHHAARP